MSRESSTTGSSSLNNSESSSSSSQALFFRDKEDITDLTLFGSPAPTFTRTGTVIKRTNSVSTRKNEKDDEDFEFTNNADEDENFKDIHQRPHNTDLTSSDARERLKRCLENTYGLSLDLDDRRSSCSATGTEGTMTSSIREYTSSTNYSSSECTDYAMRSCTETNVDDKTLISQSTNYLSWIESVNSGFQQPASTVEVTDVDNKVGEWNNFWLNYKTCRGRYLSSPVCAYSNNGNGADTVDEMSEVKSSSSTPRDGTGQNSLDMVSLTHEEVREAIRCSQRIADIMQNAMKRSEQDSSNQDSYYSPPGTCSRNSLSKEEKSPKPLNRERSVSCGVDPHLLQKQKQTLAKNNQQSSSTSCINTLLTTGVADILKRVITKRREAMTTSDDAQSVTRSSFSEWSTK